MRIFFLKASIVAGIAMVAGCSSEAPPAPEPEGQLIPCAIGPGTDFEPVCTGEQITSEEGADVFIIHHPDGSFRRFEMLPDGKGVALADGADELTQEVEGDDLVITLERSRYRLPTRPIEASTAE